MRRPASVLDVGSRFLMRARTVEQAQIVKIFGGVPRHLSLNVGIGSIVFGHGRRAPGANALVAVAWQQFHQTQRVREDPKEKNGTRSGDGSNTTWRPPTAISFGGFTGWIERGCGVRSTQQRREVADVLLLGLGGCALNSGGSRSGSALRFSLGNRDRQICGCSSVCSVAAGAISFFQGPGDQRQASVGACFLIHIANLFHVHERGALSRGYQRHPRHQRSIAYRTGVVDACHGATTDGSDTHDPSGLLKGSKGSWD